MQRRRSQNPSRRSLVIGVTIIIFGGCLVYTGYGFHQSTEILERNPASQCYVVQIPNLGRQTGKEVPCDPTPSGKPLSGGK